MNMPKGGERRKEHERTTTKPLPRQKEWRGSVVRGRHGRRQQGGPQPGGSSRPAARKMDVTRNDVKTRSDPRGNPSESHQRSASVPLSHAHAPTPHTAHGHVGPPASRPPGPRGLRSDSINIPPSSVAARGWRAGLRGWEQGIRARKAGGRALWAASVTRDPDRGVRGAGCAGWGDTHLESEPENSGSAE